MVRAEMGPDAVILSTRDEDGRVEIRAAIERSFGHKLRRRNLPKCGRCSTRRRSQLSSSLRWHGAPDGFVHMVSEAGSRLGAGLEQLGSLSAGLEGVLTFNPLNPHPDRSILLVGPHWLGQDDGSRKDRDAAFRHDASARGSRCGLRSFRPGDRLAALMLKASVTNSHLARSSDPPGQGSGRSRARNS